MKKILFVLLAVLLIAASCKAPEPVIVEKPVEVVCPDKYMRIGTTCCLDLNDNKICDSDEVIPADTEAPLKPDTETSELSVTEQIYEKAKKSTEVGYSFSVADSTYFVKNNKMKLFLGDYVNLGYDYDTSRLNIFDTVYLDLSTTNTFGVCSGRYFKSTAWDKTCTPLEGIKFPLPFADYYFKTPVDWLKEYKGRDNIYFREYDKEIRGMQTDVLIFDEGATLAYMWVDHESGLPIRVQIDRKRDRWSVGYYEYADLVFYLDDEEVVYS
ncbi:hypothetical protein JW851_01385 [Candidatus Woesearchaeota archaeon]|nr:hypothetical protein [Candidatus Woesearchaeota archaeon]